MNRTILVGLVVALCLTGAPQARSQAPQYNNEVFVVAHPNSLHVTLTTYLPDQNTINDIRTAFNSQQTSNQLGSETQQFGLSVTNFTPDFGSNSISFSFDVSGATKKAQPIQHGFLFFTWQGGTKYFIDASFLGSIKITQSYQSGGAQLTVVFDYTFAGAPISS